jgi:hypothetical protein
MSCNSYNTNPAFKECAGRDCDNVGTIKLKIKFIKKVGHFCKSCTFELKTLDLIDDIDDDIGGINKA